MTSLLAVFLIMNGLNFLTFKLINETMHFWAKIIYILIHFKEGSRQFFTTKKF